MKKLLLIALMATSSLFAQDNGNYQHTDEVDQSIFDKDPAFQETMFKGNRHGKGGNGNGNNGNGNGNQGDEDSVPIDSGIVFVAVALLVYGWYKIDCKRSVIYGGHLR